MRETNGLGVCIRFADVTRVRPPARTQFPALTVVPGDLDTLRAWAVAAGDVRSAILLLGIRDGLSGDRRSRTSNL